MNTQARLKEILHYNPKTGVFTWKIRTSKRIRIGYEAGCIAHRKATGGKKYRLIKADGALYLAHRLAWLYVYGEFPPHEIDHIDGNGINNKLINLRSVTRVENSKNVRLRSDNTSGFVGVHWDRFRSKWVAYINAKGKLHHLGYYEEIIDAAAARMRANKKYSFHANHGQNRPL
jgi:hypothetical protein